MKAALALALLVVSCSMGSAASPSPTVSGSPLPGPSGKLSAQVPMPVSFPADVPIYPKARLTAAAAFPSSAPTSWGMEWQTLDPVSKVYAYYAAQMNQGNWAIQFTGTTADSFSATFKRKSDPNVTGTLVSDSAGGVSKILMSLVTTT